MATDFRADAFAFVEVVRKLAVVVCFADSTSVLVDGRRTNTRDDFADPADRRRAHLAI